jgi:hypothetical protein
MAYSRMFQMKTSQDSLTSDPRCVVHPTSLEQVQSTAFDALIASIGFENRARFFCENHRIHATKKIAYAFTDRNAIGFEKNVSFFDSNRFIVDSLESNEFSIRLYQELDSVSSVNDGELRMCVDISSMSRSRMANVVEVALMCASKRTVIVDFVYCVATYSSPPNEPTFIETAGPVTPFFAGWTTRPEAPTCAIFGVGYEPDRVIGAIEYLEPGPIRAFVPVGTDPRFLEAVLAVNQPLWDEISKEHQTFYRISEPFNTFVHLESLLYSVKQEYRPILVPFGPKIFTIECLLAAVSHYPSVAVWRVSGGTAIEPIDIDASGEVHVLQAEFGCQSASATSRQNSDI